MAHEPVFADGKSGMILHGLFQKPFIPERDRPVRECSTADSSREAALQAG